MQSVARVEVEREVYNGCCEGEAAELGEMLALLGWIVVKSDKDALTRPEVKPIAI